MKKTVILMFTVVGMGFAILNAQSTSRQTMQPRSAGGTVVVGMALSDGLILAADSRLTITFDSINPNYKIASDSAPKLFSIGNVEIATYDTAFLLGRSTYSFVAEFEASLKGVKPDVDDIAKQFSDFFGKYYDLQVRERKESPRIGFLFAGYDKSGVGKIIEIIFPTQRTPANLSINTREAQRATWRGQTDVIQRLIKGYDPVIGGLSPMKELTPDQQKRFAEEIDGLEYSIPFNYMMLQDGVDFALSMVQITVDMQRFAFGTRGHEGSIPGVGGTVDVLAITPADLIWVQRKTLVGEHRSEK